MAKKDDFDLNSDDSKVDATSNELEIIELWDNLPNYCKTPQILEKVKSIASPSIWNNLIPPESLGNCE